MVNSATFSMPILRRKHCDDRYTLYVDIRSNESFARLPGCFALSFLILPIDWLTLVTHGQNVAEDTWSRKDSKD